MFVEGDFYSIRSEVGNMTNQTEVPVMDVTNLSYLHSDNIHHILIIPYFIAKLIQYIDRFIHLIIVKHYYEKPTMLVALVAETSQEGRSKRAPHSLYV